MRTKRRNVSVKKPLKPRSKTKAAKKRVAVTDGLGNRSSLSAAEVEAAAQAGRDVWAKAEAAARASAEAAKEEAPAPVEKPWWRKFI